MISGMSSIINCNKVCALILFFISLSLAFRDPVNHWYESHKMETRSQRHYCGTNLVRALHFLCESYNKRSSSNTRLNTISEGILTYFQLFNTNNKLLVWRCVGTGKWSDFFRWWHWSSKIFICFTKVTQRSQWYESLPSSHQRSSGWVLSPFLLYQSM